MHVCKLTVIPANVNQEHLSTSILSGDVDTSKVNHIAFKESNLLGTGVVTC